MSIADDLAAYFSRWDLTGDLDVYARAIGQMFAEVEGYAEDVDGGTQLWVPLGHVGLVERDQPIAWWRLGDRAGTVATDSAGVHPGAYAASVVLDQQNAIGDPGASALFNGSGDDVGIPFNSALATPAFTLEMWVYPTVSGVGVMFNGADAAGDKGFYTLLSAGSFQCQLGTGSSNTVLMSGTVVPYNEWSHLVVTYDGSEVFLYRNGAVVAAQPFSTYVVSDGSGGSLGNFSIGGDDGTVGFEGYMQEVALYDYALSSDKIAAHYAAQLGQSGRFVPQGGQVGWQPLWDNTMATHEALVWLCMVFGEVAPQGATDDQLRSLIQAAPNSRRGTPNAIASAIKQCLTGGQLIGMKERWRSDTSAADNDSLSIFTYLSQTPDQNQVQAAIRRTVPADINVYYSALTGPTWDALQTGAGSGTWSALYSHYSGGTWSEIESNLLALPGYVMY